MRLTLRKAEPQEAGPLSDLAWASKAFWGYGADLMEACRADLTVSARDIQEGLYVVAEQEEGCRVGFYSLAQPPAEPYLKDLFVAPEFIGRGVGRLLWQDAVTRARGLNWAFLLLESDPHAEGFYRAMGAVRVGEVPSPVLPGRVLPLMRLDLR
ncbi:GNAT family N-acetyltransferase [Deinococcus sp. YIM 77859]|uniref:GNAT family N-acetyltransferase n=1 Tax=Deinococcus sp. YIM 77859 TaxID=1540221 RepID=UPI0005598CEE|nr:GNAT family N-acetyltransferase [Deinococcus sp. YIM 77859]